MNEALFSRRDAGRRGGFTLIEVVIALAIFLFGAVAIIRIFPGALGVIQNSGDQLTAINLNRSALAKFEKSPGLLPDAIYDTPATATTLPFAGAVVGTALRNSSLPRQDIQDFDNSALGRFKTISGETHTVSISGTTPYVVAQYPYDTNVVVCEEDEVDGVIMKDDGRLNFSEAKLKSTGLDFKDSINPAFPPTTASPKIYINTNANGSFANPGDTVFYVSYTWIENTHIQSTVDEPLIYPSAVATLTQQPPQTVQGRRMNTTIKPIAGPVQVRFRRLKYVAPIPPNTPASPTFRDEYRGIINLSASAAPNNFIAGETVSIDYTRKDWRWLVSDDSPSVKPENALATNNYRVVTSPVRFLDKEQPIYTFLVNQAGVTSSGIYQGGTGTPTSTSTTMGFPPATFGDAVNFKTGQITFDIANSTSVRSRVTYQTLDNWTHQLSIAARSYKPYYSAYITTPAEPWRDYAYDDKNSVLYFRPSEAGKSVSISYTFNAGADVQVNKRVLQISQDIISSTTVNSGVAVNVMVNGTLTGMVSKLDLTDNSGNPLTGSQVKGIQGVLGASIQSRTAWLDGNKFAQVSSVGFRDVNN